jgi:hypothetical protein
VTDVKANNSKDDEVLNTIKPLVKMLNESQLRKLEQYVIGEINAKALIRTRAVKSYKCK